MKETKTAEEVLGETYAALLGSGKNHIIEAMEAYAEQARQEERIKTLEIVVSYETYLKFLGVPKKGEEGPYWVRINEALAAAGYRKEES